MARRWGFGPETGETEKGGLTTFEGGHVEVSEKACRTATENYPTESPAAAVGLTLATEVGGADLSDYAEGSVEVDYAALSESLQDIDGIGESTADEIVNLVRGAVGGE